MTARLKMLTSEIADTEITISSMDQDYFDESPIDVDTEVEAFSIIFLKLTN